MSKLATKSTHKRKNYNKKHLANKLDNLAKKVAKRDVFIVKKTDPGYNIVNYVTKQILVENVPFLNVAKRACKTFNASKEKVNGSSMQKDVDVYFKHYMDIQFYKNTVKTSQDKNRVFNAGVRMADSLDYIREAKLRLSYF